MTRDGQQSQSLCTDWKGGMYSIVYMHYFLRFPKHNDISSSYRSHRSSNSSSSSSSSSSRSHAAREKRSQTRHARAGLKLLAGAVNLNAGGILYRPVFGHKFGSKNEAMQDFVASFLFKSSATAEVLHVQLATPIVKCEPAWKLYVALMFNHKRSHPRTLAACGIMSIMMLLC